MERQPAAPCVKVVAQLSYMLSTIRILNLASAHGSDTKKIKALFYHMQPDSCKVPKKRFIGL